MSTQAAFDTLSYAKKLKTAGFTDQQAKVQAEALAEIFDRNIATKRDLAEMELRVIIKVGAGIVNGFATSCAKVE